MSKKLLTTEICTMITYWHLPQIASKLSKEINRNIKLWKSMGYTRFAVQYEPQCPGDPPDIQLIGYKPIEYD